MAKRPCTSRSGKPKKRWPNRVAAEFVALLDSAKFHEHRYAYYCRACDGWHVATDRSDASPTGVQSEADGESADRGG